MVELFSKSVLAVSMIICAVVMIDTLRVMIKQLKKEQNEVNDEVK